MESNQNNNPQLRRLLSELLPSSSDFDAFVIDYYPAIYRQFSSSMERTVKTNLLLSTVSKPIEILNHLQKSTSTISYHVIKGQLGLFESPERRYIVSESAKRTVEMIASNRTTCTIYAPSLYGKTTCMNWMISQLASIGDHVCISTNIARIPAASRKKLGTCLSSLASHLAQELAKQNIEIEYPNHNRFGIRNFSKFLETTIDRIHPRKLIIGIDNADLFVGESYESDLYNSIREMLNRLDQNLLMILTISRSNLLNKNIHGSPFNIGLNVRIGEFIADHERESYVRKFSESYNVTISDTECADICHWLDVHPFLLTQLFSHAYVYRRNISYYLDDIGNDSGFLVGFVKNLREYLSQFPGIYQALREFIDNNKTPSDESKHILIKLGILWQRNRQLFLRGKLYSLI